MVAFIRYVKILKDEIFEVFFFHISKKNFTVGIKVKVQFAQLLQMLNSFYFLFVCLFVWKSMKEQLLLPQQLKKSLLALCLLFSMFYI